jgi:hypothetical protein
MSDQEEKQYQLETRISSEVGFKFWLIFFLGFALLGVQAIQCLVFSAIAGWVVYRMVGYWRAEEISPDKIKPGAVLISQDDGIFQKVPAPLVEPVVGLVKRILGFFSPKPKKIIGKRQKMRRM